MRAGVRSRTSAMVASQDLPLLARTVTVSPTSSGGSALALRPKYSLSREAQETPTRHQHATRPVGTRIAYGEASFPLR